MMTNAELNLAIARLVYPDRDWMTNNEDGVNTYWRMTMGDFAGSYNYCNNWNDLMPLVVELGVTYVLTAGNKEPFWIATHRRYGNVEAVDLSEQALKVALAKCALKVLEARQ